MSSLRKRKEKLWAEKAGKCYWCGEKTVMPESRVEHQRHFPQEATIDHLRTKFDSNRYEKPITTSNPLYRDERLVLSCYECNHVRGKLIEAIYKSCFVSKKAKIKFY